MATIIPPTYRQSSNKSKSSKIIQKTPRQRSKVGIKKWWKSMTVSEGLSNDIAKDKTLPPSELSNFVMNLNLSHKMDIAWIENRRFIMIRNVKQRQAGVNYDHTKNQ